MDLTSGQSFGHYSPAASRWLVSHWYLNGQALLL